MNFWEQILSCLRPSISQESYQNWLNGTAFVGMDGEKLFVSVPDRETRTWLETEYSVIVRNAIRTLNLPIRHVSYESLPVRGAINQALATVDTELESGSGSLNPKFTFDSFVVGACNQFAHAAAQSVAMNPSRSYNPLFIYGGVGMGQTHLMHAIGRALMARGRMRIIYTTSERFTNEVVRGIKHERMPQLR